MKSYKKITDVIKNSIADEAGVRPGEYLVSINDQEIIDTLDYEFLIKDENIDLYIEDLNGEIYEVEIEKDFDEDLGLVFESELLDDAKTCHNNCIFCFMDQLPQGMRSTLTYKDDDYRLSFIAGNYVTLTNLKESDIDRIIKYRLSPINISVHTTDEELRCKMLNNKFAGNINKYLKKLADSGININCQIVLCPNVNDKEHLDKTIKDLSKLFPNILSISIVPVGITKYRKGLFEMESFNKDSSTYVIKQVNGWQEKFLKQYGSRIVFLGDEFYMNADIEVPVYENYEDFPQLENGVGMVSTLIKEFNDYFDTIDFTLDKKRIVSIATGVSASKYIKRLCKQIEEKFEGLKVNVYPIINKFFGEKITVTGLITGQDLIAQLKEQDLGEELIICNVMLKDDEDIFLDDVTLDDVRRELNIKINAIDNGGRELIDGLLGI